MKTTMITITVLFLACLCNAQVAQVELNQVNQKGNNKMSPEEVQLMVDKHNKEAIKQISAFLSDNLTYTDELRDYGLEGQVLVQINISKYGEVEQLNIVESASPQMDSIVLSTLHNLKKIDLAEKTYLGKSKMKFPIKFSL